MADLRTRYMGLKLKNPVIVGASNLVSSVENLKRIEKSGAGAIVYKSLFEEQIQLENLELYEQRTEYEDRNAEMITLFPNSRSDRFYPEEHLMNLRKAKDTVGIPVIASLNAVNDETWIEYSLKIEETGVDALELNFYTIPDSFNGEYEEIEEKQIETLKAVKSAVKIPVSLKLSPFYTNPLRFISDLDKAGADGIVLFNRLFQPDINTETQQHQFSYSLSNPEDQRLPLRFAGLLYDNIKASICTNSGIFTGKDVIKMILAGTDCVEVVSTLYLNKIEIISSIVREIEQWMDENKYGTIESFKGKLSNKNSASKLPYRRAQYIDFMMTTSEIIRKYKTIS
jgi:dihydroorotate dehydrogenase (fumarate)